MSSVDVERRRPLATPALTCCAPATRRADDPEPYAWLRAWSEDVYRSWCGPSGVPPLPGETQYYNYLPEGDAFVPPQPIGRALCWSPQTRRVTAETTPAAIWAIDLFNYLDRPSVAIKTFAGLIPPGGLFACTVVLWDAEGADSAAGCGLRRRIYSLPLWKELALVTMQQAGFDLLGKPDWRYKGHALGDRSIGTIAAVRRSA